MSAPPRRGRRVAWTLAVVGIAAAVAVAAWRIDRTPATTLTLVEPVSRGSFVREVTGTGVVEAAQERTLGFAGGGTVAAVPVQEGARVVAGQTLAQLDGAALERDAASVSSSLVSARADRERLIAQQGVDRLDLRAAVAQAEDQTRGAARTLDDAQRDLDLSRSLFGLGAASRDQVRAAEGAFDAAQRALAQAEFSLATARSRLANLDQSASAQRASSTAQIAQLENQLATLQARLADTTIVAPFAGVVTAIGAKSGDLVGTQSIITLADTAHLLVRGRFDENRAIDLQVGQRAWVVPDASAGRRLDATIDRISPVALRDGVTAQVAVELTFDPGAPLDETLARPGYTVTVRVRVREIADALLMPLEAITELDGEAFVYRVVRDEGDSGVAQRVSIRVIERNPTVAAIEGDLRPNDLIALINLDALVDGARVSFPPVTGGSGRGGT